MTKQNGGDNKLPEVPRMGGAITVTRMAGLGPTTVQSTIADSKCLELLHTEVRDLQMIVEMARRGEVKLEEHQGYIGHSMQDIRELMSQLRSDEPLLRHLHDIWEQLQDCPLLTDPANAKKLPLDEQLAHYTLLNDQFKRIIFQISATIIPAKLNRWLEQSRTGYYIPFHVLFSDELPDLEDRVRLLNYLAYAPGIVKGLVDVEQGLIFRYADDRREQQFHFKLVLLALLSTFLVVSIAFALAPRLEITTPDFGLFVFCWFALLIGVVVHRAVDTLKGKRPPIIAIGELGLLLSATHGRIILKLLLALIAFFGLVLAGGAIALTPFNALLAGYSLDSVVEVFGGSLEKRSAAQLVAFKQQLGLNDPG